MKPLKRHPMNKNKAARRFSNSTRKTKAANLRPQRGGYRL